jgi:hypothetical protein
MNVVVESVVDDFCPLLSLFLLLLSLLTLFSSVSLLPPSLFSEIVRFDRLLATDWELFLGDLVVTLFDVPEEPA